MPDKIKKLADEKKKIDSQFETLKDSYKEDDFVRQIGNLSFNNDNISSEVFS